ncbi:puromycin-sensitive aminopeptidase isoform X2 [Neocloeon triangulifer]|uniref:puromycin-sensitive aminopeptidase isoform X2 n=1 Tax=Neocloeon triangulifer TaxID=2078957 RepID=UPI00286F2B6D|nr:puromycin-sensitive aminopeptidase isoform X2 [Neocloeon triangulifer]
MSIFGRLLVNFSVRKQSRFQLQRSRYSVCGSRTAPSLKKTRSPVLFLEINISARSYSTMAEKKPFERLPKVVRPKHYDLFLQPDLQAFTFNGNTKISVQVSSATEKIILNSIDLSLKEVIYTPEGGVSTPATQVALSTEEETATLTFQPPIQPGVGSLFISFTGELNDKMKGFYRSQYTSQKVISVAAVTYLCPTSARRMFPCFDEPSIKSTFSISILSSARTVLSNMPVASEEGQGENRLVKFERTPIMSTYLVAVVVGEFDYVEDVSSDGIKVRVYTPLGKKEQGKFALHVATKVLPHYKEYFQVAYPLPKIDLIAIADFSAGAMENWGLVTYRETCLLVDSENTSAVRKQWIALVVGHELAHQWFGNLVTMEWWTHLWLNEGYASFVEFLCVEHLFPEYDIWTQFVTDTYVRALELDCLENSHPIEVPVGHPSEIDEIFDDISYNKGASVIRMLHRYIGDEDFRKGMNLYLTRHQFGNAETEDLWAALEEASGKPVKDVMSSWTKQKGFPVISISSQQKGDSRELQLIQRQFCAAGDCKDESALWLVPITLSTAKEPDKVAQNFVFDTKSKTITLENVSENDWVKVNPGTVGFYRTRYSPEMLSQLIPAIKSKTLPPLDRLGLLDDVFAMVQAGHTDTTEVLRLMLAFAEGEENFTVWSNVSSCLGKLDSLFDYADDCKGPFRVYAKNLLSNIYLKLGWDPKPGESHLDTLLRSLVIGRLGWLGHEDIVNEARIRFEKHISGEQQLPADLRSPVYRTVLAAGDAATFDTMLKLYRSTDLQEEKDRISRGLGALKDQKLLQQVLDFAMSDEVRSQDTIFVVGSVASSRDGRNLAWAFLKKHLQTFTDRYQGGFLIARLVKMVTENFASEDAAKEVEQFFATSPVPGTERTVQQSVETIRLNTAWLNRDQAKISAFFATYK